VSSVVRIETSGLALRQLRAGRWLLGLAPLLFFGGSSLAHVGAGRLVTPTMLAGVAAFIAGLILRYAVWHRPGVIVAKADGLLLGRQGRRMPLAAAREGYFWAEGKGWRVELSLVDGRALSALVDSQPAAEELLRLAQVAPSQRALRMRLESAGRRWTIGYAAGLLLLVRCALVTLRVCQLAGWSTSTTHPYLTMGLTAVLISLTIKLLARPMVAVGVDGVMVQHRWRRRFIGHSDISSATATAKALELELASGEQLTLPCGQDDGAKAAQVLAQRINHVQSSGDGSPDRTGLNLDQLDRGSRSVAEWRRQLESLELGGGYRAAALSLTVLRGVLEDVTCPPDRRLAAALLLRRAGDAPGLARLRPMVQIKQLLRQSQKRVRC